MSEVDSSEKPDARALAREALIGMTLAHRYTLRGLVGQGGMGAVYEAEHLGLGKSVAVKLVDPEFATDERIVARFAREARAMSAIESPHIVTVLDAGTEGGRPFLVMELLRGEDLGQRLRRTQRVPLREALHVLAQVLKGLAKAHAAGIVHRDLKPDNVFVLKRDGDPLFAKIVDFGVSKIERPRDRTSPLALTGRGTVLGTPFYMSPEQAQAAPDIDARADLYSVGAILFECLTGRPPHTGETYEQVILSICLSDSPDIRAIEPSVSAEVAAFVARALARDRNERFRSANRMLAALHDLAPEERHRVPLDLSSETLLSEGASGPESAEPFQGAKTHVHGSQALPAPMPPTKKSPGYSSGRADLTTPHGSAVAIPVALAPSPDAAPRSPNATAFSPGNGTSALGGAPISAAPSSGARSSSRRSHRSRMTVIVTALLALVTGIVVMLGIIMLFGKKPESSANAASPSAVIPNLGASTPAATITSGMAIPAQPSGSVASSDPPTATDPPAANVSPTLAPELPAPSESVQRAEPAQKAAPPAPKRAPARPAAKPSGSKLDIARDLP